MVSYNLIVNDRGEYMSIKQNFELHPQMKNLIVYNLGYGRKTNDLWKESFVLFARYL